jgi:hypothetical protein
MNIWDNFYFSEKEANSPPSILAFYWSVPPLPMEKEGKSPSFCSLSSIQRPATALPQVRTGQSAAARA